eukprot:9595863-Karenia_brevis.AAC.1
MACLFQQNKSNKAVGEDLLDDLLFKKSPALAFIYWPLFLKACLQLRPPLQFRGGMLHELLKGSGNSHSCTGYRDINLVDSPGKSFGRMLRSVLYPSAAAASVGTQWGAGMNGGETSIVHLYLKAALHHAALARKSGAALFIDVVTAFATMHRRFVFHVADGDECFLNHLQQLGFDSEEIKAIYSQLCQQAWHEHTNSAALELASQLHTCTWNTIEGTRGVLATHRGTGAGAPLADLAFCILMSIILKKLRARLE